MNENMQKLVLQFTDGLAAFEIVDEVVTPLYASDNVCEFFGFTRDEWLSIMKKRTPIKDFVSRSKAAYGDFMELLAKGEAEFTYRDLSRGKERRIKAICSQKSPEGDGPRYIMLYNIDEDTTKTQERARVRIRTFGYFDVFVDDHPVAFATKSPRNCLRCSQTDGAASCPRKKRLAFFGRMSRPILLPWPDTVRWHCGSKTS